MNEFSDAVTPRPPVNRPSRPAYKFTLSSGKVVILAEPKVSDMDSCTRVAGSQARDNQLLLGVLVQKELVKKLLLQVNDKRPTMNEKEDLDSLFTLGEFSQVAEAVQKISSTGDDMGKLSTPELVTI